MSEVILLLLALALTLACAVFVAAEFSLTTIERSELERAAQAGERGAESALKAAKRLTFQLSGAQLGITVTSLVIGMLAEPSLAVLLRGPLEGVGLPSGAVSTVATLLGVAASTVVLMVIGELVPKNWAISSPLTVAKVVSTPQRAFTAAFAPLIRHLNNTANRAVRRLGLEPAEELASARTPDELIALAQHSAREGAIEQDSAELFVRTLHLAELSAENVMTPRVDVRALEAHATAADAANLTLATGLSRFPVYRDSLDEVIGTVHIRDVLALDETERSRTPVTALATEPLLVPDSLPVDRLLAQLRKHRTMAVVIDEYGGTAGVATVEDIVEEVVGEVRDEHDPHERPDLAPAEPLGDGRPVWAAEGSIRLDQLDRIGFRAPEGPYETLAGLLANQLARIPVRTDRVEVDGWQFDVLDIEHHRADRVRITAPAAAPALVEEDAR
ncbi:hemolysin family protein [Streptomyces fimicarius]|uniref:hemolysin family protein n=1 Tax=Streptomyces TaxID=1883 RepID=UPI0004C75B32|nr:MULTISPECIES: hemolysin family protein [Streptomyces]MCL6289408.1 hemolysin family protein [Streptomyces sp. 43Y-GA-1]MCX4714102.1 hemolysin family protein [Streptomyces griseus]MDX2667978.1 hemolysin family protein [Streptomyces sp. NRRL_ISP-5395]MDX3342446.1 hemolysin family protein [Streptomyces sp. ME02-6979.5a]MDX3589614.1 hemolysin family protein [Streptomyces sp. ID03-2B]